MNNNMFLCRTTNDVKTAREAILQRVRSQGYTLLRGLFDPERLRQKTQAVFQRVNTGPLRASSGVAPDEIRRNMAKWSIGGQSTSQAGLPRCMVTVYNPLFEPDIFDLHADFRTVIAVRDLLADRPVLTDDHLLPDRFNACRIQIYPAGGGFMGEHADSRGVANLNAGQDFIQILLLLTQRGIDYQHGGAFVSHGGAVHDTEANSQSGDLLVYDGATRHGVQDIDPHLPFDGHNLRGRAVALATIYNRA